MTISDKLKALVGVEERLDAVNIALRYFARDMNPPVVGAYQISCSDESEGEWTLSFHKEFVRALLPDLKFLKRSAFHTANLGARYEQGALGIAEEHYAGAVPKDGFKLMLVKLHSHVSVVAHPDGLHFGEMVRYGQESAFCGALDALLKGTDAGFTRALQRTFAMGGIDRLAMLRNPEQVNPGLQSLYAAIVNTQLQAERILEDVRAHKPQSPTVYVIASSVTLNRVAHDTELLCGVALLDCRGEPAAEYVGLGTDPSRYTLKVDGGNLQVTA